MNVVMKTNMAVNDDNHDMNMSNHIAMNSDTCTAMIDINDENNVNMNDDIYE